MSQMDLFGKDPTKIKYISNLPLCGVCETEQARYYTQSNFHVWVFSCQKCSRHIRDGRFTEGYLLSTTIADLIAIEETPIELVLVKGKRIISCPVCKKKHSVTSNFHGDILCYCAMTIKVKDLWLNSK